MDHQSVLKEKYREIGRIWAMYEFECEPDWCTIDTLLEILTDEQNKAELETYKELENGKQYEQLKLPFSD